MSYILDALRKTQTEQDPVAAANLALSEQRTQRRFRVIGVVVTVALLANAAVLVWLFGPTGAATSPVAPLAPPMAATTTAPESVPPSVPPAPASASADRAPQIAPQTRAPARPASTTAELPVQTPVQGRDRPTPSIRTRLADLPADVRARFPGLAFSTHIYADDPELRAIVANGRRLVEGDEIGGAEVAQITEDGVVLAFERYLVEIPVVSDWD